MTVWLWCWLENWI